MQQTTAAIQAIFLALAVLVFQSWGYFAVPQLEDSPIVQQSDIEQGEESQSLLELSVPTAPEKGPEVRTAPPKTPKDSSKSTALHHSAAPIWAVLTSYPLAATAGTSDRARPPTTHRGYPHSHGNRGPPLC